MLQAVLATFPMQVFRAQALLTGSNVAPSMSISPSRREPSNTRQAAPRSAITCIVQNSTRTRRPEKDCQFNRNWLPDNLSVSGVLGGFGLRDVPSSMFA